MGFSGGSPLFAPGPRHDDIGMPRLDVPPPGHPEAARSDAAAEEALDTALSRPGDMPPEGHASNYEDKPVLLPNEGQAEVGISDEQSKPLWVQAKNLLFRAGYKPEHARPVRPERRKRIFAVAALAGALGVTACTSGGQAGAAHSPHAYVNKEGPPSATASAGRSTDFHANLWHELGEYQDQDALHNERKEITNAPSDLLVPTNNLSDAVDFEAAKAALNDDPDSSDPSTLRQALGDAGEIQNGIIREQAVGAVEATFIKTAVDDASEVTNDDGGYDPAGEVATLKQDLASLDTVPEALPAGEAMLQAEDAKTLLTGFQPSDPPTAGDLKKFMRSIDKITDPGVRKVVIQSAEASFAAKVLLDLETGYSGLDKGSALALIDGHVTDAKVRELAETAIATYEGDGAGGGFLDDEEQLQTLNSLSNSGAALDDLEQQKQDEFAGVHAAQGQVLDDYFDQQSGNEVKLDQAAVNRELYAFNGHVSEASMDSVAPLPNPKATLDLTHVHASTVIPNVGRFNPSEDQEKPEPATYNQFAEIYSQDGQLRFRINNDSGLDDETKVLLNGVFNNIKPILDASFARGDVVSVHFVSVGDADDYNPNFSPVPHEIYLTLMKNNVVSAEELQSMIVHETAHSLVRGIFNDSEPTSKADTRMILNTCDELRESSYDELTSELMTLYPGLLKGLLEQAQMNSPEDAPLFEAFIKAVNSSDINGVFGADTGGNAVINSCQQQNLNLLFYSLALATPHYPQKLLDANNTQAWNDHFDKVILNLKGFSQLSDAWNDSTSTYLIYSTLNEANYINKYGSDPNMSAGHTDSDANEVVASVFDNVVNFPQAFGKAIGALPNDAESGHARDAALRSVRMALALVVERNESLDDFLDEKMQQVVRLAGESPDNARYWLPKTKHLAASRQGASL